MIYSQIIIPGDQYYDLKEDRKDLRYGYPYAWINGRELIENGRLIEENNNFLERRLLGGEIENRFTTQQIRDSTRFVQGARCIISSSLYTNTTKTLL
jgi:hypothetical protein